MVQENICKHSRDNIDQNPSLTFMRIYLPMLYLHPMYHAAVLQTYVPVSRQTISSLPQKRTSINWPPSPTSSSYPTTVSPTYKTYCDTNKPSTALPLYSLAIFAFSQSGPGRSRPKFPTAGGGNGWREDRKHYKGEQASEGQESEFPSSWVPNRRGKAGARRRVNAGLHREGGEKEREGETFRDWM
jgi:hypothetical protein